MTTVERERTLRVLGARNKLRLAAARATEPTEGEGEGEGEAAAARDEGADKAALMLEAGTPDDAPTEATTTTTTKS